jgi:hypothetical protein
MTIGYLLWEGLTLAVMGRGKEQPRLWIRFSLLLFGVCMFGLAMGSLLSPYGFGWFLLAMGLTLYLVAKVAPKLLKPFRKTLH